MLISRIFQKASKTQNVVSSASGVLVKVQMEKKFLATQKHISLEEDV